RGHYYVAGSNFSLSCTGPTSVHRDSIGFGSSFWVDKVYLSADSSGLNTSTAILLGQAAHGVQNSGVNVGESVFADICLPNGISPLAFSSNVSNVIRSGSNHPGSLNFTIPYDLVPGDYYLYVLTNSSHTVYEYPGTAQTKRSNAINIQRPDLVVPTVTAPS